MPLFRRPILLAAVLLTAPATSFAGDANQCVAAYEEGQKLRAAGQLKGSRDQFLVCADPACPSATKTDCTTWVSEVEASLPTVIFAVTDREGRDLTDVKVTVDGTVISEKLDGKAVVVDPGARKFVFEQVGEPPIEREIVVREGEKNRNITVSWKPDDLEPTPDEGGGISPATWILGGVGVVGMGLFATFAILGSNEKSDAEDTCAPNCSDETVDSIRTKFIVADVSLGVGSASLAAALIVGLVTGLSGGSAEEEASLVEPRVRVGAAPTPGGGFVHVSGTF